MGRITVCLSCPEYQKGGYCKKKRKDVGALQPACQEMTDLINNKEEDMETTKPTQETKRCPKCGRDLPLEAFNKRKLSADGLQTWCRECTNEAARKSIAKKAETLKEEKPKKKPKPAEPAQTAAPAPEAKERPGKPGGLEPMEEPIPGSEFMILPRRPIQDPALENFASQKLADELRARGYHVDAFREIRTIEQL